MSLLVAMCKNVSKHYVNPNMIWTAPWQFRKNKRNLPLILASKPSSPLKTNSWHLRSTTILNMDAVSRSCDWWKNASNTLSTICRNGIPRSGTVAPRRQTPNDTFVHLFCAGIRRTEKLTKDIWIITSELVVDPFNKYAKIQHTQAVPQVC